MPIITPVILSGGSGTRLWPASRAAFPKQLLALVGERTLLQATVDRVSPGADDLFGPGAILTNVAHAEETRRQLADLDPQPVLILEPFGRNTAACAAVAAIWTAARGDPEGLVLLAPADHHIPDVAMFRRTTRAAVEAARSGRLVTIGIKPTHPETGYGYVRMGDRLGEIFEAAEFVEKPDLATAEAYLAHGRYYWNGGYFLFRADRMLAEMARLQPDILDAARAALAAGAHSPGTIALDPAAFEACPSDSIDYAIMEKTDGIAVSPLDGAWSDLGSWTSIWETAQKDTAGNVASGDVLLIDARDCLVRSDGPLVTVLEAEGLIVVVERGVVMVAPKAKAQKVKSIVDALRRAGRTDLL